MAVRFAVAALVILGAAPLMTLNGARISELTGIAQTAIGVLLLAVTTSLPELTTSLAAVKIRAYDLAVGNLFGSNAANMSIVFFADLAYRDGPILSAVSPAQSVAALGAILLTALALAALVAGTETRIRRLEPDATVLLLALPGSGCLRFSHQLSDLIAWLSLVKVTKDPVAGGSEPV